ncbi:Uncharacterised protein [Legionella quateirensis]|uniref:Uncharacterized protein n=1 Tax=Legionella quateirensis TaxID=45072 RepID=A0A378KUE0_9GAMM|nr:Uncharacterised protein [Legionella quateirensis]
MKSCNVYRIGIDQFIPDKQYTWWCSLLHHEGTTSSLSEPILHHPPFPIPPPSAAHFRHPPHPILHHPPHPILHHPPHPILRHPPHPIFVTLRTPFSSPSAPHFRHPPHPIFVTLRSPFPVTLRSPFPVTLRSPFPATLLIPFPVTLREGGGSMKSKSNSKNHKQIVISLDCF